MAKVIFRENPLCTKVALFLEFDKDISAKDLISKLNIEKYPLHCKVNGVAPEIMDNDFVFKGKDLVELSPLLEGGGGGDGGGKNTAATILTVIVAAAAIAVSGGALAGVGLAAGSVGAALAGAAVGIAGNLLIGALFSPEVEGNTVAPTATTGVQINDVGISAARNQNPYGMPICLPMGNCCRIAPPHGMQPYTSLVDIQSTVERFDYFWLTNDNIADFPCAQTCFQYTKADADIVGAYFNFNTFSNASPVAISQAFPSTPVGGGDVTPGWFGPPTNIDGYQYEVCPMYLDRYYGGPNPSGLDSFRVGEARKLPCVTPELIYIQAATIGGVNPTFEAGCTLSGFPASNNPILWNEASFNTGPLGGPTQTYGISTVFYHSKGVGTTEQGLGGFNGIRLQCWVVLCDPDDPFFGHYVRLNDLFESGMDPSNIQDPNALINGNPTLDANGEILEMEPFCDVDAEYCVRELINTNKKVKRVHQLFNFGYGDLKIEDTFFGTTPTNQLQQYEEVFNEQNTEDWPMPEDSCVEERVDTTAGATLTHNDTNNTWQGPTGSEGPESLIPVTDLDQHNWVERCGVVKTNKIGILIEGQLFNANPQIGIQNHSEIVQLQYRPYNSVGPWTAFNGSPLNLTGYDSFPVREEVFAEDLPLDKYCVRVRRVTIENKNENVTSNLNFSEVKWFQEDCKAIDKEGENTPTNYKGQNRMGICLTATGQTNGALGNFTAKVSTAMWIFDIDEFKQTGAKNWVWDCEAGTSNSSNPAFAFLYFLRGGYCNSSADPTASPAVTPLDGGHTSYGWHNGEHPDNEELLWGAGLSEKGIDLDCICEWACYNHENEFCFDYYLCDDKSAGEVLDLIARTGRATWGRKGGKICPVWEEADQPYVTIFSEENILEGSFQVAYSSRSDNDRVTITYTAQNEEIDPENTVDDQDSFDGKPIQVTSDIPFSKQRGNELRVELVGVRKRKQAQREANIIAAKEFFQKRIYTFDTNEQGMCLNRGDIVLLSSDLTQPSFSSRLRAFDCDAGLVTNLYLTRDMDKPVDNIKIRLVCGDIISASVTKVNDKQLLLTDEVQASKFPIFKDQQGGCNASNLSDNTFGDHPEDVIVIGASMDTPGKRVRITDIDKTDMCKVSITAVDDDPAIYAYEFNCCPDPIVLPDQEVVPFVCARIKDISVIDCGDGLIRVCYEAEGAYGVQAQYSLNGGSPVNVMSGGQYTITNECFELQLTSGDRVNITITPFVVGEPFSNETGCISHVVQ